MENFAVANESATNTRKFTLDFFAESKISFLFVNGVALLIKLLDRNILQNSGKFRNVWGNGQKLPKVPR